LYDFPVVLFKPRKSFFNILLVSFMFLEGVMDQRSTFFLTAGFLCTCLFCPLAR
jgi:hypothetical protein